jgi:hypothetical protein
MENDHTHPPAAGTVPSGTARRDTLHRYHEPDSVAKLSTTVAHALANVMGEDVTQTEFTLFECIDPDALDAIFSPLRDGRERCSGHVAFNVRGYQVTVYSSGHIVITPPAPRRQPA